MLIESDFYWEIFENARDVILLVDLEGNITGVNKAVCEYGFTKEFAIGRNIAQLLSKDQVDEVSNGLKMIAKGHSARGELEIETPLGKRFGEYNSNPLRVNGRIVGAHVIIRDMTERSLMWDRIVDSLAKYRDLFETIREGIIYIDIKGRIIDCNQAFADIAGLEKDDLYNMSYKKLSPKKWAQTEFNEIKKQVLRRGYSDEIEKEFVQSNGSVLHVVIRAWRILNEKREIVGVWAIVRDVTEQKKQQAELERCRAELERLRE